MATTDDQLRRSNASGLLSQIPTAGYRAAPAADGSQSNPLNTEFGRNVTNTLSALPGAAAIPGAAARVAGSAAGALGASAPAASLIGRAAQTVAPYAPVGGGAAALMSASGPATSSPASPPATSGSVLPGPSAPSIPSAGSNPTDSRLAGGSQALPPGPQNEVAPGVFQHGRGQYSDSASGMDFKPGFTGQPTARNKSLIDALATQPMAGGGQPADGQSASPQLSIMEPGGYGLRDQGALAERNALVSAGSLRAAKERAGDTWRKRGGQPGVAAADVALSNFYKDRGDGRAQANTLAVQGVRTGGDLAQTGMREMGANQRSLVQAGLDQQKIGQGQQRINQEGETQGYSNRAAGQLESLRATLLNPSATAEQRQSAQQALMAIQGKEPTNRFTVVPGGQQIDPVSQKAYNTPSSVLNNQTGQFVPQGQGSGQMPPGMTRQVGTSGGKPVYEDAQGNRFQ